MLVHCVWYTSCERDFFLLAFVIVKLKSIADYCRSLNKNEEMQLICMWLYYGPKDMTGEAFGSRGI